MARARGGHEITYCPGRTASDTFEDSIEKGVQFLMPFSPPRHQTKALIAAAAAVVLAGAALLLEHRQDSDDPSAVDTAAGQAMTESRTPLRYDAEYEAIGYSTTAPSDRIARLQERLQTGDARLELHPARGYLDSLLQALDIDPASQLLVFSTTSLQVGNIRPRTPRALYFNDDTYVAWVQGGGPIEIASMDPKLGPIFYTLEHSEEAGFDRQMERCLRCHDSLSLSGGGVPRFILGSGYIGTLGNIVSHEGWIVTQPQTPIKNRWGGWYVTGEYSDQAHLGNIVVRNVEDLRDVDALRIGTLENLDAIIDTSPYLADSSDIAALMVIQHQVDAQNHISRANYKMRTALHAAAQRSADTTDTTLEDTSSAVPPAVIAEITEPLVRALLFADDAALMSPVSGHSGFAERFEQRGPRDAQGRSLRELDLTTRLMRYPLSYVVYTPAFDALPEASKEYVYRRFVEILRDGQDREAFPHLSNADRTAVFEILKATKPAFAAAIGK